MRRGCQVGKFVDCPFCGQRGLKTKEHVWAQWLHESDGAQALLADTHGERIARVHQRTRLSASRKYETYEETPGPYAKWLPNLTVLVCTDCNSGWMSRLEERVQTLLGPYFDTGVAVRLTADDLAAIATWATKSWMAYALTKAPEQNPFTVEEYRAMSASPAPLERSRVWLMHSEAPNAQVAMGVASTLFNVGPPPDLARSQDNAALGYLAASSVVFYLALVPHDAPEGMIESVMAPKAVSLPGVRQCWPSPRPQFFPLETVSDGAVRSLIDYPEGLFSAIGLPVAGLTDADTRRVMDDFLAGADPAQLRNQWTPEGGQP